MPPDGPGTGGEPDPLLAAMAEYLTCASVASDRARETARLCLREALACAFHALRQPDCAKLLGPVVPGATLAGGARVPGTSYELDPVQGAFNIGAMICRPESGDAGFAAEWGYPSDSLGGILAVADWLARRAVMEGRRPLTVGEVLAAQIRACEIQGVLALGSAFERRGVDRLVLVSLATAAVVAAMLGGTRAQVMDAAWHAWIDGAARRSDRQAPQAGSRRSWAAGDASARGVRLALLAVAGETSDPPAPSAGERCFCDDFFEGRPSSLPHHFGSYAMESVSLGRGQPVLAEKFGAAVAACFGARQAGRIEALFADAARLEAMPVTAFMATLVKN